MKTYSKIVIALGAIAMMAGIAIGCSKTGEEQSTSLSNETKEETNEDMVFFVSRDVNSRGDTIVTKTMFRNGVPIKAYFNDIEFDL